MAFTSNLFLRHTSNINLKDPQHAARLFTDDQFRLAPKHKFLFHVAFNINQSVLLDPNLTQRHRNEINMLVKGIDLPKFTVQTETLNQYNRKKNIQYTHKYEPINVTFHDDNMGVINYLWQNYYGYYYADSLVASDPSAYQRNATKKSTYINVPYGLDNGSNQPFFNYITIYQMARHEYVAYKLYNPIITSWNHNRVEYSQNGTHDNLMTLAYEAVEYSVGDVLAGDPEGFGLEHYDVSPSPLVSTPGAGTSSPTFTSNAGASTSQAAASTVLEQLNTYQNTQQKQTTNILSTITQTASQGVSGLQGISFASSNNNVPTTVAKQSTVGQ